MGGYIRLWRKIRKKWYWPKGRPYTELEAWLDMILNLASGVDTEELKRGEFQFSTRQLSKRWLWTQSKVFRYLKRLELDEEIEVVNHLANHQMNHLSITKYNELNPGVTQQVNHLANHILKEREKKDINISPPIVPPLKVGDENSTPKLKKPSPAESLFTLWQGKDNLTTHRRLTPGMKGFVAKKLKAGYTKAECETAIHNYARLGKAAPGYGKWSFARLFQNQQWFDALLDDEWQGFTSGGKKQSLEERRKELEELYRDAE